MEKKRLNLGQIINMSVGFLGIQFGFALQNGFASRILQTFGADVHELSWFWLAAPFTGMLVQPIIGYYSDRTWTKLGRRRPYFLAGAILASIALIFMPNAQLLAAILPPLYIGAGILMIMDTSFNIAMEPFRALVADKLPTDQRTLGFSIQTMLIGIGAVAGSLLPYFLAEYFGVEKLAPAGEVPRNVVLSFYAGALVFIITIVWTVITTTETPPSTEELAAENSGKNFFATLIEDFKFMPKTMKQLGWVQFFSWFALFSMWVFTTPAIATHIYGLNPNDPNYNNTAAFQDAGNWVGVIFGVYNGISALYALALPFIAAKIGRKMTHAISLTAGGIGLIAVYFIKDPDLLIFPMIGVGFAWASILAMPYAILAGSIPAHKMGIYMGVFNFFITFPQIINGIFGGPIVKYLYGNQAIYAIVAAGIFMLLAAISVVKVEDKDDTVTL